MAGKTKHIPSFFTSPFCRSGPKGGGSGKKARKKGRGER